MKKLLLGLVVLLAMAGGVLTLSPTTLLATVQFAERQLAGLTLKNQTVGDLTYSYYDGGPQDAPAIVISTRVAHGARSRRQAAVEVGILNRSNAWVWWQVIGRDIVQTATVEALPFAPHHLMTTMEVFLDAMKTRDDLALRVGGDVA